MKSNTTNKERLGSLKNHIRRVTKVTERQKGEPEVVGDFRRPNPAGHPDTGAARKEHKQLKFHWYE